VFSRTAYVATVDEYQCNFGFGNAEHRRELEVDDGDAAFFQRRSSSKLPATQRRESKPHRTGSDTMVACLGIAVGIGKSLVIHDQYDMNITVPFERCSGPSPGKEKRSTPAMAAKPLVDGLTLVNELIGQTTDIS
jgi:hypothetical protein